MFDPRAEPQIEPDPIRLPSAGSELACVREQVELGNFILSFNRPEGWTRSAELEKKLTRIWVSPAGHSFLIIGHAKLNPGETIMHVGVAPSLNMNRRGFETPVFVADVILDDGSQACTVYYPVLNPVDLGCIAFKIAYLKELDGHWFSVESFSEGGSLDPASLIEKMGPYLSSIRVHNTQS